ncbi:fatty acid-binding protein, adipocyte-like [Pecten maximus]|uniref:fatty acid-binding protein, adipocyte-like n=1 Tax=Pecten maximus TaxID=6579 RepID=UPI001458896F|nr:fatty acid-binding protein, adipocyte-like [Pecten maximus]
MERFYVHYNIYNEGIHILYKRADDTSVTMADSEAALEEVVNTIGGVWVLDKNENLDDYLKEIGVNFMLRKLATVASSTMTITREGNEIRIVTKGPKDTDVKFELGKEVVSHDPNDNELKAIVTWSGGKLTTDSTPTDGSKAKATLVERWIEDDQLIMSVKVNDVKMKRIFKKKS